MIRLGDTNLLRYVEKRRVQLSYSPDLAGTDRAWRCWAPSLANGMPMPAAKHEKTGFGKTARAAIRATAAKDHRS